MQEQRDCLWYIPQHLSSHQPFEGSRFWDLEVSSLPLLMGVLWKGDFSNFVFHELAQPAVHL